jgi:transcriptional regulator with XRE-family HTH domain
MERGEAMVEERPARGRALAILRNLRAWSQQELAEAAGLIRSTIGGYEQGTHALTLRKLWELARVMGHSKEKVRDVLRLFRSPAVASERWVGPVRFTAAEERALREFGDQESRRTGFTLRKLLTQARVQEATHQDRRAARELWGNLRAERRLRQAIQEKPEYQTWAISELLCEESIQAAPSRPDRALELAEAAVLAAELAPGEERWRLRVLGYAQAHVGNAFKVVNEFKEAENAFARFDAFWQAGRGGDPKRLLNEGRVFGLQAALFTVQERFEEALKLIAAGLKVSSESEKPHLLLTKARALEAAEECEGAIEVLQEATPFIKTRDLRISFSHRFMLVSNLCNLERFSEAHQLLGEVQRFAFQLGKEIDCWRVRWLEGRVAAGLGKSEAAVEILSAVREEFSTGQLPYDAALVAMDLASVLLKVRRTEQVKALARQMTPIFKSHGVHSNARSALLLFLEAAQVEATTVDLVHRIARYLRRARFSPELEFPQGLEARPL